MLSTTPPTTNWSEPRPWSKVASSPSILLHSDNGTNLTTPRLLAARRTPNCPKKKKLSSTVSQLKSYFRKKLLRTFDIYISIQDQNLLPSKRNLMPAERKPKLPLPWLNNSPKVVSLPVLLPDQVKPADATDTSLKAKNSTSTSENSRPRNPNKCKDSNKWILESTLFYFYLAGWVVDVDLLWCWLRSDSKVGCVLPNFVRPRYHSEIK